MRHELVRAEARKPIFPAKEALPRLVELSPKPLRYAQSRDLPRGTQARMIAAAKYAEKIGYPIDAHLTINAAHLRRLGEGGVFGVGHLWGGFQALHELMRKWVTARGVVWVAIWAREWTNAAMRGQSGGEHWHIALHLPKSLRLDFANQVAAWTGEGIGAGKPGGPTKSTTSSWCLTVKRGEGDGTTLAAYLGKAEPNRVKRYGKRIPNPDKLVPRYGGEGPIEGKRFGISKSIGATIQRKGPGNAEQ